MTIVVREHGPDWLDTYATIPIAFETHERMRVIHGASGFSLEAEQLGDPFVKDYDLVDGEHPRTWTRFDLSNWAFFGAYDGVELIGAAAAAMRTEGLGLLEGRNDLTILWDIRVLPARRGHGAGSALLNAAEQWAAAHGAREMRIETQNTNPDACRFYERSDYRILRSDRAAYPVFPDETQLIWTKPLRPLRRIVGFHQDDEKHWVADLECGHTQHVRHDPPWQNRPWVVTAEGRARFLGTLLPCLLCAESATSR